MHDYKKLEVWKKSVDFVKVCYDLTSSFPDSEKFGLTSQVRRSAVSIASNIAEGAGRDSNKEFAHFLAISQGSCFELETQIIIAQQLGFIGEESATLFKLNEIGKMIRSLRNSIRT
jgi:four helix bundle protein